MPQVVFWKRDECPMPSDGGLRALDLLRVAGALHAPVPSQRVDAKLKLAQLAEAKSAQAAAAAEAAFPAGGGSGSGDVMVQ